MSVRKIRNTWWVDFRFNHVRYRKRSPANNRSGALAYEATLRGRLGRDEPAVELVQKVMLFRDHAEEWRTTYVATNNKPSEQRQKECVLRVHLLPMFGSTPLDCISAHDIEKFKALKLSEGLSATTVNNHLGVLGKCLRTAQEWDRLNKVPTIRRLRAVSQRLDFLSDDEVDRLMAEHAEFDWHRMVVTALHAGLRLGELFALDWSDVDLTNRLLVVRRSMVRGITSDTKSHRIRYVPMTATLENAFRQSVRTTGPVFRDPDAPLPGHNVARRAMRRICKRAGIRSVGWHILRHTFASRLVARGTNLRATQLLLGHSTVTMTERYAHLAPSHLRDAIAVLDLPSPIPTVGQQAVNADAHLMKIG